MNAKKLNFFFLLLIGVILPTHALSETTIYSIEGKVIEAENNQTISYATVRLLQEDSVFIVGTRTDEKGTFSFQRKELGTYLMEVHCAGYETLRQFVVLDEENPSIDLGMITLQPTAILLKNTEVIAERKQITMKGDTLVYNADAFRVPPGSTLGTLLSRLPGVTIEEGTIKFHGKEVNRLLINGKEFFAGDLLVALENLPTEIVENIQAYETMTDEDKQRQTDSGERLNVLDVTIKKEYMSTWIGNTDLAAGTQNHYSERIFLTRFTDRMSISAFGQINNLNDQSEASPNGGWRSNNWSPGRNTFRKMGVNGAWDNGKKEQEAGFLKFHGNVRASHNNYAMAQEMRGETFYPGSSRSFNNSFNEGSENWNSVVVEAGITWQIDTLTNVYSKVSFDHADKRARAFDRMATFQNDPYEIPGISDPLGAVFTGAINDSLWRALVNSNERHTRNLFNRNKFVGEFSLGRRLSPKGHRVNMWANFNLGKDKTTAYSLSDIHYYQEEAEDSRRINNQYSRLPELTRNVYTQVNYDHPLSHTQKLKIGYRYSHYYSDSDYRIYQLDSLDTWRNRDRPVGTLPSADSLESVLNTRNSTYSTYIANMHGGFIEYQLSNKNNLYVTAVINLNSQDTKLNYQRDRLDTVVVTNRLYPNPFLWAKYNFKKSGHIQFNFRFFRDYPQLTQMLDVIDDRDPLRIVKGNPDLKAWWTHSFHINFQKMFGEPKASLWANGNYWTSSSAISNAETYDRVTGVRTIRPENVGGSWGAVANAGTDIPLDNKQRFNISPAFFMNYSYNEDFFFFSEDELSVVSEFTRLACTPRMNLNYRLNGLYLALNNSLYISRERNSMQPASNQTSRTFSNSLNAQYDFEWGMTLSTDFSLYSHRGFNDPGMNKDQWLWNASVSKSFLKDKSLVCVMEARDILAQRRNLWSTSNNYSRTTYETNAFRKMNYVMFHLIYRFTVGKNAG